MPKELQRINEEALQRFLNLEKGMLAETLILLAWKLGLTRDEIYNLKWENFSFAGQALHLPDRTIPMDSDTYHRLYARYEMRGRFCEYVAASDRGATRVNKNYIPICVRKALDRGGFSDIDMLDLRREFIIRNLEEHDWPYVAKITGLAASTLFATYSPYVQSIRGKNDTQQMETELDSVKMQSLLEKEGASPEGLALRMSWEMGLSILSIIELTWDNVDFAEGLLCVKQGTYSMPEELKALLQDVYANRKPEDDPHVLLSPKARKPYTDARLSSLLRTALIRGNMPTLTAVDLQNDKRAREGEDVILRCVNKRGYTTRAEVMDQLHLTKWAAYAKLGRLIEQKKLQKVGTKYYPYGSVIADPEEQYEAIHAFLEEAGFAFRQDLANVLHVEIRQSAWILKGMVDAGKLVRSGQRYFLPEKEKGT